MRLAAHLIAGLMLVALAGLIITEWPQPSVQLIATDWSGQVWVAGQGSTCAEAWRGAVVSSNWRELTCR